MYATDCIFQNETSISLRFMMLKNNKGKNELIFNNDELKVRSLFQFKFISIIAEN